MDCTLQILKREGIRGLYKGLGATLVQVTPTLAVNFTAYETSKAFMLELLRLSASGKRRPSPAPAPPKQHKVPPISPNIAEDPVGMEREWSTEAAAAAAQREATVAEHRQERHSQGGAHHRTSQGSAQHQRSQLHVQPSALPPAGHTWCPHAADQANHGCSPAAAKPDTVDPHDAQCSTNNAVSRQMDAWRGILARSVLQQQRWQELAMNALPDLKQAAVQPATEPLASPREGMMISGLGAKAIVSLVAGSAAGIISSTLTFPLDVIRRNLQAKDGAAETYMQVQCACAVVSLHCVAAVLTSRAHKGP